MYNPQPRSINLLLNPGTPHQYTVLVPTAPQVPNEYLPAHNIPHQFSHSGEFHNHRYPHAQPLSVVSTRNNVLQLHDPRAANTRTDIASWQSQPQQQQQQVINLPQTHHISHRTNNKYTHNNATVHQAEDIWYSKPREQPDQWTLRVNDAKGDGYHKWEYKHVHKGEMEGCGCWNCEEDRKKGRRKEERGRGRGRMLSWR
ncbi:hypothetical protein BZA77DRAFT_299104 [Pyronema omphalodes]|nr:hypothetical protein BZA77DRAFT_299104 [Pyronema omphalodes]